VLGATLFVSKKEMSFCHIDEKRRHKPAESPKSWVNGMSPIFGFNGTLWYREGTVVAVKARNPRLLDEGIVVGWLFRGALELRIDPFAGKLVTHDLQCASTISGKGSAKDLKLSALRKRRTEVARRAKLPR